MQIKINKSNKYIGFCDGFVCSPIIASSEKKVLLDIEDEIYRTCNWLSKKPPKGVETFKGLVTKVDCLDSDIEFFNNGELAKGEFSEIKLQLVQGLFSFKCMVESVNNTFAINDLTEQLKNLYSNYTNTQTDGGFLEVGFNLIDAFEENCQLNGVKTKAYMYKTLYLIVDTAKRFYTATKDEFKNITNSFYF